ncbi:MAG: TerC family protein [Verrucomicrobia bacterium]|nr:TerC family protein [Verrucomicrobiota bacterium]MBI3871346.1 TerC family protein [Verrucomicrobiota bacterium]
MLAELVITPWHWAGFVVCVLLFLAFDLGIFHRSAREVRFREALGWTAVWFTLAMGFAALIFRAQSQEKAALFVTGYIVELSLSMDNVFVIALIFRYFQVQPILQHRVLFWGIAGALLMRGLLICAGAALVHEFRWLLYPLGAFLVFTGIKMVFVNNDGIEPERNPVIRLARRFLPVSPRPEGQNFTTSWQGRWALTPLAIVLLMVETTDLVFALDSLPAIFGITQDSFIIFTSNMFAILGLRSLYFVLAEALEYFTYLKYGLSAVLVFIGAKMVTAPWVAIPTNLSLGIVAGIILVAILASLVLTRQRRQGD